MPTVAIVDGVKIQFFYQDHPPPHFHAWIGDDSAVIALGLYEVLAGSLPPPKLRVVIEWARRHERELTECWQRASVKQSPGWIE